MQTYKVQRPCRVCGKLYTPCSDCDNDKTAFHWRSVACSIECGRKYLQMVLEARGEVKPQVNTIEPKKTTKRQYKKINKENNIDENMIEVKERDNEQID